MFFCLRRLHPRGPDSRGLAVDADGAVMGPDCILVRRTAEGYRSASLDEAAEIQQVAFGRSRRPDWLFDQCCRIAKALGDGNVALAQIYGVHASPTEFDDCQLAQMTRIAALVKANFDPDQPRIPAGGPGGGEWTTEGDTGPDAPGATRPVRDYGSRVFDGYLIDAGYPLGQEMWSVARDLYRLYRDSGGDIGTLREYLDDRGLNLDDLPDVIRSVFDPPKPLSQLQSDLPERGFDTEAQLRAYLGDPPPGYEWHHLVEQNGQFRADLTSSEGIQTWIQNTSNMVLVPVIKHYCISGMMSSGDGSGVRMRDVVRGHSPPAQRDIGIDFLRECGIIP